VKLDRLELDTIFGPLTVEKEKIRQLKVTFRSNVTPARGIGPAIPRSVFHNPEPAYEGKKIRAWIHDLKQFTQPRKGLDNLAPTRGLGSPEGQAAQAAIRFMGPRALPFLMEMIRNGGPDSNDAVEAFKVLGPLGRSALPDLLLLLDDSDDLIRNSAISALGFLGPSARQAVPALIEELQIGSLTALESLGNIGPVAVEAVPIMISELERVDRDQAQPWVISLGRIGSEAAVPILCEIIDELNVKARQGHRALAPAFTRQRAVEALGQIGKTAHGAVPLLVRLLREKFDGNIVDLYFKLAIVQTLGRIGPEAREAIPLLEEMSRNAEFQRSEFPQYAAVALNKIQAGKPVAEKEQANGVGH